MDAIILIELVDQKPKKELSEARLRHLREMSKANVKYPQEHGLKSRLYNIWRSMTFRCYYPSHEAYPRYGGAGITVCDEWRHDYMAFRNWSLANGYAEHLTIDRKENELGYSPDNCRYATYVEQNRNRRDNVWATAFGETKMALDWVADPRCKVSADALYERLKQGMSPEEALTKPARTQKKSQPRFLSAFNERKPLPEWANDPRCVVSLAILYSRIYKTDWPDEQILLRPARGRIDPCSSCANLPLFPPEPASAQSHCSVVAALDTLS